MPLKLPDRFQDQLINAPEISYGANKIAVILKDGRRFEDVIVASGREVVKVGGSERIPFDADDIVSIEIKIK